MQKLLTIHLSKYDESSRDSDKKRSRIEEHLKEYLTDGWQVKSMSVSCGSSLESSAEGWRAVVIEREEAFA